MAKKTSNNSDKKPYEIAFLLDNPAVEETVADILKRYGADILRKAAAEEMRLAYEIGKRSSAFFGYIQFEAGPADIEKIKQTLKLNKSVLRSLIVSSFIEKQEQARQPEAKKRVSREEEAPKSALTNEALEEKLEEILK
ncbi:MAG: 30S ribosomal protein S6 [Candidatus Pacebacteria bacterium]|nr:30S ribosomal protein S6 [Candidatus Paceibacterota bacterium]